MSQTISGSFGDVNFAGAQLGDARRTKRLIQLADLMGMHPGGTLPAKLRDSHNLRAFYGIMDAPEVTHAAIMAPHFAVTQRAIAVHLEQNEVVLIIHDGTELDYTHISAIQETLGQIGQGTRRGYVCHNSLAVQANTREVLGLTSQILHHRADVPEGETRTERRERENRESLLWVEGAKRSGPALQEGLLVDVSDSLSDTFEYMVYEVSNGRHFLLRSKENRSLAESSNGHAYLHDAMRSWECQESYSIDLKANNGRKPRTTEVNISFGAVCIAVPRRRSGNYENNPLSIWAVRVWEPNPPAGEEPVEWLLLTSVETANLEQARTKVDWYGQRFIIEDFHKGMKTGCGIETLQFEKIERLEPAIGVLSVLATKLLKLRDAARQPDAETRPATDVVDPVYVEVLRQHFPKRLKKAPSVKQFYMHVARLGGHQNRKRDGFPGWITLWRGWMTLEPMVAGYRMAMRKRKNAV